MLLSNYRVKGFDLIYITREKSFGTIFCNNPVIFPSKNHEKPAIFQDIFMNIHEHFYEEIKTVRLEKFEEKI